MSNAAHNFTNLVERIRNADDGAMCELIQRYDSIMERIAHQMIGRGLQPHVDAQDVVQTVCVTLWVGIRSGRFTIASPDQFLALARTLLSRQVSRYWRRIKCEMSVKLDSSMAETLVDGDLQSALAEAAPGEDMEIDELLEKVMGQIDEIDQRLVMMRFQGYTTSEAAAALQVDSGFLRVRLGRLRKKFSGIWEELKMRG
jgi:RNA polymerase sigma-70 factor (ECF subfamily)